MNRKIWTKKLISKVLVGFNFKFPSYEWLCVFHCFDPQTIVFNKVSCTILSVKIALISYWNDFSPILGKCASERRATKRCKKKWKFSEHPLFNIREYAFKYKHIGISGASSPMIHRVLYCSTGPHSVMWLQQSCTYSCILVSFQEMPFCIQLIFVLGVLFLLWR